jgi:hypothetical protein
MTSLAIPALGLGGSLPPRRPTPEGPEVVLWTNRSDDLFARGDRMSVFFRTDVDAYVTVFRIDADGHVQVVFPRTPTDDRYVRGGRKYRARGPHHDYTLRVEEYPGEGFLFAIATLDPLPLHPYARGNHWDYAALGIPTRVTGDPYLVLDHLLARLVPDPYAYYGWSVRPYSVAVRHGYPRFLCYQCHAYVSPVIWDPYAHSCIRFRVTAVNWWDYPGGRYPGGVVVVPPIIPVPRYVVEPLRPDGRLLPPARARRPDDTPRRAPPVIADVGRRPAPAAEPDRPAVRPPATREPTPPVARRPAPASEEKAPSAKAKSTEPARRAAPRGETPARTGPPGRAVALRG